MTMTTAQNVLEIARALFQLSNEVDELRARIDRFAHHREGLDVEQLAELVVSRLEPQIDAVRRTQRLAGRRSK